MAAVVVGWGFVFVERFSEHVDTSYTAFSFLTFMFIIQEPSLFDG